MFAVAAIFGGIALTSLKQELIPSIEFPQLSIVTTYPGASPEVVSNDVSGPIETAIQGVPGLESTSSTSTTNASIVQASFTYGTDLATAEQKILQGINRIKSQLPEGLEPNVLSFSIDDFPVIQLAVTGFDATTGNLAVGSLKTGAPMIIISRCTKTNVSATSAAIATRTVGALRELKRQ